VRRRGKKHIERVPVMLRQSLRRHPAAIDLG
jgi:hypothetical protein